MIHAPRIPKDSQRLVRPAAFLAERVRFLEKSTSGPDLSDPKCPEAGDRWVDLIGRSSRHRN